MKTFIFVDANSFGTWAHRDGAGQIVLDQRANSGMQAQVDSGLLDEAQRMEWFQKYGDYELIDLRQPIPQRARATYDAMIAQQAILRSPE